MHEYSERRHSDQGKATCKRAPGVRTAPDVVEHREPSMSRMSRRNLAAMVGLCLPHCRRNPLKTIPVLCYHRVLDGLQGVRAPFSVIAPRDLEEHLRFIASEGFLSLGLQEYWQAAAGRLKLEQPAVMLTFDDGYRDVYEVAWPIAKRYGVTINVFPVTGMVGHPEPISIYPESPLVTEQCERMPELWRPMTWDELRRMDAEGAGIGLHGHTHRNMALVPMEELSHDIDVAVRAFKQELNKQPLGLALPYGGPTAYSDGVLRIMRAHGLDLVFGTITGRSRIPHPQMPISRLVVHCDDTVAALSRMLRGACDWVGDLRRLQYAFHRRFAAS